jgi:hypothetical protein
MYSQGSFEIEREEMEEVRSEEILGELNLVIWHDSMRS